jgi:hypothetical protein
MGYDRFAELVIDEKAQAYKRAISEHWLMFFTHDPQIAAAEVYQTDAGRFETKHPLSSPFRYHL